MARLLTLSFHAARVLLNEDVLFKKRGIESTLLTEEALGDSIPQSLRESAQIGAYSGLTKGVYPEAEQVTLNRLGGLAWLRPSFKRTGEADSAFETWLRPKVETACACLLLAGHHARDTEGLPWLWGAQDQRQGAGDYRFWTALAPRIEEQQGGGVATRRPQLWVYGHPTKPKADRVLRAGPFDFSSTLADCRLVVIMGCNAIGYTADNQAQLAKRWQEWVAAANATGNKPIVLGWYGTHGMPRDDLQEHFSTGFWSRMRALSQAHGNASLKTLCEGHATEVIGAWGQSLKAAFGNSTKGQQHLWFGKAKGKGAGALGPDGSVWKVLRRNGEIEEVEG